MAYIYLVLGKYSNPSTINTNYISPPPSSINLIAPPLLQTTTTTTSPAQIQQQLQTMQSKIQALQSKVNFQRKRLPQNNNQQGGIPQQQTSKNSNFSINRLPYMAINKNQQFQQQRSQQYQQQRYQPRHQLQIAYPTQPPPIQPPKCNPTLFGNSAVPQINTDLQPSQITPLSTTNSQLQLTTHLPTQVNVIEQQQ